MDFFTNYSIYMYVFAVTGKSDDPIVRPSVRVYKIFLIKLVMVFYYIW